MFLLKDTESGEYNILPSSEIFDLVGKEDEAFALLLALTLLEGQPSKIYLLLFRHKADHFLIGGFPLVILDVRRWWICQVT